MSTRKLILTAFIAGLAILIAGGVQLLRISRADDVAAVHRVGESAIVDGVTVSVTDWVGDAGNVRIGLPESSTALIGISSRWALQRGSSRFDPVPQPSTAGDCMNKTAAPGATVSCSLTFSPSGEGTSYLRFTANGKTAVWALP